MAIFEDNVSSIGNTPLVRINRITAGLPGTVLAKIEGRNPGYSVKCRLGAAMIRAAELEGRLVPGKKHVTVVEATSGNTGIALSFICASRGYPLIIVMPETMSIERRKIMAAFGTKLILTEGVKGMAGSVAKAEEMAADSPGEYFLTRQFMNPANAEIHFRTTGPEIWKDSEGKVDIFVAGVGTGGTMTGVANFLKSTSRLPVRTVAVEPANSAVLTAIRKGEAPVARPHKIQGIGAGFKPDILDLALLDEIATVSDDEALEFARRLHREEGITCGISSGAAMAVSFRVAQDPANQGKTIVTLLPDAGERYLSTALFEGIG